MLQILYSKIYLEIYDFMYGISLYATLGQCKLFPFYRSWTQIVYLEKLKLQRVWNVELTDLSSACLQI